MNGPRRSGPLGAEDLEEATATLSDQRDRLRAEIAGARETESALRADCDLDAADTGAKAVTVQELHTRIENAEALLERTLAALARIRDQTFGVCTACGAPIGRDRVMALPHAGLCVACTKRQEKRVRGPRPGGHDPR
ncbi:TraR/DksA family transcriptional regulator [Streptomyces sp. NPDC005336]|uniref:TraR/DksA family transcriptional regulator n=1 Tax=unclassified Streptomyces TaxID=2593676 RepID=UPI0033AD76F1